MSRNINEEQPVSDKNWLNKVEEYVKTHTPLVLVMLVSLMLLAGTYYLRLDPPDFHNGETVSWWGITLNLTRGYGYSLCNQYYFPFCNEAASATAMREPAPIMLFAAVALLFKESLLAAGVTELLLLIGVMVTLFFLTREWAGSFAGLVSAIIWVIYPRSMSLISQVSGDLLAGLGVTFGILFTMRARRTNRTRDWILAGMGLGIAIMSRSAMLMVAFTVVVGLVVERWGLRKNILQWLRPSLLTLAIVTVIMTPWLIRTKLAFGKPLIGSSLVGYNIFRHNYMLGTNDYYLHYVGNDEGWAAIQALVARRIDLLGTENEAQMDVVYREEGFKVIAANPVHYVLLSGYRFFMLWFDWRVSEAFGYPMGFTEYFIVVIQAVLLIFAFIGLKNNLHQTWPLWASLIMVSMAYMAVDSRLLYTTPVMPLVISLSTAGALRRSNKNFGAKAI